MRIWWFIAAVAALWLLFGGPKNDVASWLWGDNPAPWETVDAFYYPDRSNLSKDERRLDVGGLAECRAWVRAAAVKSGRDLARGDYECGVGYLRDFGDLKVYRRTAR